MRLRFCPWYLYPGRKDPPPLQGSAFQYNGPVPHMEPGSGEMITLLFVITVLAFGI